MSASDRPQVSFHTGVPDVVAYALRLVRKAAGQRSAVRVVGDPAVLDALDEALWTESPESFLPHVRLKGEQADAMAASASVRHASVWLVDADLSIEGPQALDGALRAFVNLGGSPPGKLQQWDKIIELVGADSASRESGQARWRYYRAEGLEPSHHAGK